LLGEGKERAVLGREAAPLGIGEAGIGKDEIGKGVESAASLVEPELERGGERAGHGRGRRGGPQHRERVAEKAAALGVVLAQTQGDKQRRGLAVAELMAPLAGHHVALKLRLHPAQGIGERGPDGEGVDLALNGGVATEQGVTAHDPALAPAEQPRDGGETDAGLGDHRVDDAGLVERREGAGGSVGAQHQGERVEPARGALEDDGHGRVAGLAPAMQALEAVDDLEGAVCGRDDPQRQIRQRSVAIAERA
jgi:hypothetical protein